MAKLLLTFTKAPIGVNPSQLFDDQQHLDGWVVENAKKFPNPKLTSKEFTFDGGSAIIEQKSDTFTND